MTIASYSKLQRYWGGWDNKLKPLITGRSARLFFPAALEHGAVSGGKVTIRPPVPIFIYNAPTKASSQRDKLTKLAIFISGSFEVSTADDQPCMDRANCNVTFYTCRPDEDGGFSLAYFDAMHFDFELADKQTAFHPIFHVQRGMSNDVGDETVRALFHEHLHVDRDKVRIASGQGLGLGTPYLRLPTPQLDMFSVMTLIMADFFCNGGQIKDDAKLVPQFRIILDYLRHEHNVIREGHGSKMLKGRIEAETTQHVSAAHWYSECMDSGHATAAS